MNKELKKEFIKYFGIEKWNEEEQVAIYQNAVITVCNDYLGIEPIPVIFDDLDGEVARYDIIQEYIILNRKYINNYPELINSTLHELEHHWQRLYVSSFNTPKAKRWQNEFKSYNPTNIMQEIEIDAYAFAQVICKCEFGIDYKHPNELYQEIIDEYIRTMKLTSND